MNIIQVIASLVWEWAQLVFQIDQTLQALIIGALTSESALYMIKDELQDMLQIHWLQSYYLLQTYL